MLFDSHKNESSGKILVLLSIQEVLLAKIKLYLQICTTTVIKIVPSCFPAESIIFLHITSFLYSIFFAKFCSNLKLILDQSLIASLRIHVERAIQRIKTYSIVRNEIPLTSRVNQPKFSSSSN